MLLSKKLIKSELEKIYPDIIFDNKYSENFIQVIKFNILRTLNKSLEKVSKEDAISIMSSFCFKIERTNETFDSIYRINDELILESKQSILEDFNPEHYLIKKSYISKEEESVILSLLIYKDIILNKKIDIDVKLITDFINIFSEEEINKYIKGTFRKAKKQFTLSLKDTSLVRELLFNKKFVISDREELFNLKYGKQIEDFIKTFKFRELSLFLNKNASDYTNVYINMSDEINKKDGYYIFKTEDNLKAYIKEDTVSKYDLHFTITKYKQVISAYDKLKELFISFEIEK